MKTSLLAILLMASHVGKRMGQSAQPKTAADLASIWGRRPRARAL